MENLSQVSAIIEHETENKGQYFREVLVVLFFNTLICTLVAIVIWIAFPAIGKHGLFSNWVYSQCVGQIICIGSLAFSYALRSRQVKSRRIYVLGSILIVLFGFFVGHRLASYLLSHPVVTLNDGPVFWTTLTVTIFVTLFSILFYGTWHHVTNLKLAAVQESARASKARLSMLQAQVEPHMLFNTLSNLRSLIDSDPNTAQHMLDHLVDYLRATLAGSQHDAASLKEEFALLENYLSLMAIRMGERLSFKLDLPDTLEQLKVPVLILQPVVENAIKHGLEPNVNGGHINVQARATKQFVAVEIIDSGVGYNAVEPTISGGFGLKSIRDRLQTADTSYDVLSISSPPQDANSGTAVTVRFPISDYSSVGVDAEVEAQ